MLGDNVIQSDWVKQFFFFVFMNALVFVTPYARVLFYVYFIYVPGIWYVGLLIDLIE